MEYTISRTAEPCIQLALPRFDESEKLKNEYYECFKNEISSYVTDFAGTVRKYSADTKVSEDGGVLTVKVTLSARLVTPVGITVRRRTVTDRWKGDALVSHTVRDL